MKKVKRFRKRNWKKAHLMYMRYRKKWPVAAMEIARSTDKHILEKLAEIAQTHINVLRKEKPEVCEAIIKGLGVPLEYLGLE